MGDIGKFTRQKLEYIIQTKIDAIPAATSTATAYTKRLIIAASACTAGSRTQDIAIYTKTANEGIANVRVRWGSSKFNYPAAAFYFSVGFYPDGGVLDGDSLLTGPDIAGVSAGEFIIDEYYTNWGSAWGLSLIHI